MTPPFKFTPPVIAHRGASAYAPENTMAAFKKAHDLGIHWLEFDVTLSASGEVVIFHDDTLERTSNGQGNISVCSYENLKKLDAGTWFDPQFAGECIPLLSQVLTYLSQTKMAANIELKAIPGQEELLVKQVEQLFAAWPENQRPPILFSSFSFLTLQHLRRYFPLAKLGWLMHEWQPNWQEQASALGCVSIHLPHELVDAKIAAGIKAIYPHLLCYTVNDPARARELFSWGVDAVFSDCPDKIVSGMV